jgi:hypothetical protein
MAGSMPSKSLPGQEASVGYRDTMEIGHRRPLWLREFKEIGADAVRAGLKDRKWPEGKKIVAREWLESMDMANWQANRPDADEEEGEKPRLRDRKWIIYVIGAAMLAFVVIRVGRSFM